MLQVQCSLLMKWKKKCDDDSETYNWIHANTKECPKCQATIEKDGGCNHIICRNSVGRNKYTRKVFHLFAYPL